VLLLLLPHVLPAPGSTHITFWLLRVAADGRFQAMSKDVTRTNLIQKQKQASKGNVDPSNAATLLHVINVGPKNDNYLHYATVIVASGPTWLSTIHCLAVILLLLRMVDLKQ
jgi:hypothetical protein